MTQKRLWSFVAIAAMALAGMLPASAKAGNVDFTCSLGANTCTGNIVQSGGNFSSTGIDVYNDNGPYQSSVAFVLAFNTANGTISIDGTGSDSGQNLIGQITGFTSVSGQTTEDVSVTAVWPTLPPAVQAQLGTSTGQDSGFVIALRNNGAAQSADVLITPAGRTPEPATLALFGTGLLGVASFMRRKLFS